jgi:hypothetical protein
LQSGDGERVQPTLNRPGLFRPTTASADQPGLLKRSGSGSGPLFRPTSTSTARHPQPIHSIRRPFGRHEAAAMAMSLSLARLSLPRSAHQLAAVSAGARAQPAANLAFPAKSFFGAPLAVSAPSTASPLARKPATSRPLAVVAAGKKGYKIKTHKVRSRSR